MTASALLDKLAEAGARVVLRRHDKLTIDAPRGSINPDLRLELVRNKKALLELLRPAAELETLLAAVEAEVRRLTSDPVLLKAAGNLLDNCRAMWREGKVETALFLARDYQARIPAYVRERAGR